MLTLLAATALLGCHSGATVPGKPPIVVVLVDTLRADYLGAYGFEGEVTPNLDRFARESILFRRCFAQAPWTKPSIASLFTSLHVGVHGVTSHHGQFAAPPPQSGRRTTETLSGAAVTLAEALRGAGYTTAAFVANPWLRGAHGFAQGFDLYNNRVRGQGVTAERVLRLFWKWLRKVPRDKPHFAYVHLMDVHGPYEAPAEDYEAVRRSASLGPPEPLDSRARKRIPMYLRRSTWFGKRVEDVRVMRGRYAAAVHALDRRLGAFFEELRQRDLWDDAVVVVTADHGEQLYEHGGWDHGFTLFDEELHVPLIIKLPHGRRAGHEVTGVVSLIDLMPTLLALAGAPAVEAAQGRSLVPQLDGADEEGVSYATAAKWNPGLHSARTERYKLIHNVFGSQSDLFDLTRDPAERSALGSESPVRAELRRMLERQLARNDRQRILEPGATEISPEQEERLRTLGYE